MARSYSTTTLVKAPAEKVWALLTDVAGWPAWNTTVDKVEGTVALGSKVTVHVKINPGRAFSVTVTTLDAPARMVWTGGLPLGLFKGVRTYTLTPLGDGVRFEMTEVYTGLMAPLITRSIPDLQPDFDTFAACLKRRAES